MVPYFSGNKLDPDLKLFSFNKKRFRPEIERGVSYTRDVTVLHQINFLQSFGSR